MNNRLTDEQVANWRKVLLVRFGAYANFMSREEIQRYKDNLQNMIDVEEAK